MQQNRAIIRVDHLRTNAEFFKSKASGAKFCAVVKADGYGHGAAAVAQSLSGIANCFAVSLVEEGAQLRQAGIREDILVLTPPLCEEEVLRGAFYDLIFTVGDSSDYRLLVKSAEKFGTCVRCHIKANTGMNRYGFSLIGFRRFVSGMLSDRVAVEGIYSHFYRPENEEVTRAQFALFEKFCCEAERAFGELTKHIAATGGVLASERYCMDMVRVGIGLYGYIPAGFDLADGKIYPAMKVYATVASARRYVFGGAGYGKYVPGKKGQKLITVRTGYADGFHRRAMQGNALCMDAEVLEKEGRKYEELCVFSDADEYAAYYDTISYEALVQVGKRAVREYVDKEG